MFELVFGRFIFRFLGSNIRFLFVSVFNKNITIDEIRGKDNEQSRNLYNDLMNAIVGLLSFALIMIPIMYLLNLVGLL